MPVEIDKVLYWFGYIGNNLESVTSTNGWTSGVSTRALGTPIYNINSINITADGVTYSGVGNKQPFDNVATVKFIITGRTPSSSISGHLYRLTEKNYQRFVTDVTITPLEMKLYEVSGNAPYATTYCNGQSIDVNAFWCE